MFCDKKTTSILAVCAVLALTTAALPGCALVDKGKEMFTNTEVGKKVDSSKTSDEDDYKNYASIQDAEGNLYATVVKMTQNDSKDFIVEDMKKKLASLGVNWYQAIVGDSRGTGKLETCYLYFTPDATLSDLNKLCELLSDEYKAEVMTLSDYEAYAKKASKGGELYYVESTFFGPAAGK